MAPTYHIEDAGPKDACYECGEPATLLLVVDVQDSDGYIDEVPLCEVCAEKRGV